MTDTKPPSAEALTAAHVAGLLFSAGVDFWGEDYERDPAQQGYYACCAGKRRGPFKTNGEARSQVQLMKIAALDAFAEHRAAEIDPRIRGMIEGYRDAVRDLHERIKEAERRPAEGCARYVKDHCDLRTMEFHCNSIAEDMARRAAILECADTCRSLGHYSGSNIQPAIEQIADAILALADKPAAGKGET